MLTALGLMTAASGLFLFLWYRTVVSLPVGRQPGFIHVPALKWGVPALSLILFALGIALLASLGVWLAAAAVAGSTVLAAAVVLFDRYSADMRLIQSRYRRIRECDPSLPEIEVLYRVAEWRYPGWSEDRRVELVAGKDIRSLILLMVVKDNQVNPISDWELYRSLKLRAERIVR